MHMARLSATRQLRSKGNGLWRTAPTVRMRLMQLQGTYYFLVLFLFDDAQAQNSNHDHTIPGLNLPAGFLVDKCDQGTLWDPTLSAYYYSYDANSKIFTAYDASYPTAWLNYIGRWGDQQYPNSDPRQHEILKGVDATARFTSGPTGPVDKQLNRTNVCIDYNNLPCVIRPVRGP